MRENYKDIWWLALMLITIFFAVNWIYGRTQLSGWIPLPFSVMLLVGGVYQSFGLVGNLLGASKTLTRQVVIVVVVMLIVVSISALTIFYLTQTPDTRSVASEAIRLPVKETSAENDLVIEVSNTRYGFRADGGSASDLESLVSRCQQLMLRSPDRQVVIYAESDVSYKRVIEVMDALTSAGINDIKLSTGAN